MKKETIKFVKYSGNGNDFIILDRPNYSVSSDLVSRLCDRHFGVGADGVLILSDEEGHDGQMRIFNSDGGEAEMCGNGLRCLATYIDDQSTIKKNSYLIKTMNHSYSVLKRDGSMCIEMNEKRDQNKYDLSLFKDFKRSFFINTGVPHLVFLCDDAKKIDIKKTAPFYRFHSLFSTGTNVSFVEILEEKNQTSYVRTYERGVEDETHSCGTGLTACGLALSHWFGWKGKIHLKTLGGNQTVQIENTVFYSGEVNFCFSGEFPI